MTGLREALEAQLGVMPVMAYSNGYLVQALPKSELMSLLALHADDPTVAQIKAAAIREAAAAQRSLASASQTRDGRFEHEAIADWLDQRADEMYLEQVEGAHP